MMLGPIILLSIVSASWADDICCLDVGCFSDDPPFDGFPLPDCPNDMNPDLYYRMYTRENPNIGQDFNINSVPPDFDPSHRTVFVAHGFQNNGMDDWQQELKDAFLDREDINFVIIGWEGGADIPNYLQAASNTRSVGAYSGAVIDNLVSSGGGSPDLMWCVGHSLGSHVCGHTGHSTSLGRITGLDPAGPSFESSDDLTIGLNPGSADYVDILHTDTTLYGTLRPLGHIDFYPAGGTDQPGCESDATGIVCNHIKALDYMEESVREDCFLSSSSCDNHIVIPGSCSECTCGLDACAIMGYGTDNGCETTGIYHLDVSAFPPYCVG